MCQIDQFQKIKMKKKSLACVVVLSRGETQHVAVKSVKLLFILLAP